MKGILTIRDPIETTFSREINIPSNRSLYEFMVKRNGRGGSLKVRVRSESRREFECFKGKGLNHIAFRFKDMALGVAQTITGKNFNTGKYVLWTCCFKKTGD